MFEFLKVKKIDNCFYITYRISEVQTTTVKYTYDAYTRMLNLMKQPLL